MSQVEQGATITLVSEWFEYAGGPATDLLSTPTINIIRASDSDNTVPETSAGVGHPATGIYVYNWTPSVSLPIGNYIAIWRGTTINGAVQATETIEVVNSTTPGSTWATPAEAFSITGEVLTQSDLNKAYHLLELWVGVVVDARANLKPRDLRLLKKGESYQAAWMKAQVDLLGRSDATTVSQDGLQYAKADPDMHVLGPLAAASVRRLSWMRTRSLDPLTPSQALLLRNKRTAETIGMVTGGTGDIEDETTGWVQM